MPLFRRRPRGYWRRVYTVLQASKEDICCRRVLCQQPEQGAASERVAPVYRFRPGLQHESFSHRVPGHLRVDALKRFRPHFFHRSCIKVSQPADGIQRGRRDWRRRGLARVLQTPTNPRPVPNPHVSPGAPLPCETFLSCRRRPEKKALRSPPGSLLKLLVSEWTRFSFYDQSSVFGGSKPNQICFLPAQVVSATWCLGSANCNKPLGVRVVGARS